MAIVYLHRKPYNNEIFYVGIGNNIARANRNANRNEHWNRVFNKYDKKVEIVAENISIEEAKELEIFLISEIGINNLCNQTEGGEGFFGGKHTEATKLKISQANKGKKLTDEHKRKISKASKGHPNYLKFHSKESRIKIGNAIRGRIHNENTKSIISKKHKENKHKPTKEAYMKGVYCRRANGIMIKELLTGIEFLLVDSNKYFNIRKRTIAENSLNEKPLRNKKHKGYNFTRINLTTL